IQRVRRARERAEPWIRSMAFPRCCRGKFARVRDWPQSLGNGRGRPASSTATSTNSAAVTRTRSPWPCRKTQVSTPSVIDVRPVRLSSVYTQTTSPTFTGRRKLRLDTAAVATRPFASELAATPAAKSMRDMIQPPKMSPAGLVSAGMATVRSDNSPRGGCCSSVIDKPPDARTRDEMWLILFQRYRAGVADDIQSTGEAVVRINQTVLIDIHVVDLDC